MKPIFSTFLFCFICTGLFAQTPAKLLADTKTIAQANKVVKNYPQLDAKMFMLFSNKDTSDITLPLFAKKNGFTFSIDNYSYKIIDSITYPEFRASYIYLDGNQLSLKSIDSIRNIILAKFKNGSSFFDLVKEYTMDGNPTGDLGWFTESMMAKEFETAIRQHKKDDIFTIDIPENKWYYVTLKTFDDRKVKELAVLKIKTGH
ncbi:peptidylprolyl isomerase [Ferruginibacter sp. SUN106]|uniref:peptidylprolyl isomerase n=1 Tax=Ferruginibacter sp. SUN106 TaxID=2978348 RepID=UPI003D36ACC9